MHTLCLDRSNGANRKKERHRSYVQANALRIEEEIENQDELHPCRQNGHQRRQIFSRKRWKRSLQGTIASRDQQ